MIGKRDAAGRGMKSLDVDVVFDQNRQTEKRQIAPGGQIVQCARLRKRGFVDFSDGIHAAFTADGLDAPQIQRRQFFSADTPRGKIAPQFMRSLIKNGIASGWKIAAFIVSRNNRKWNKIAVFREKAEGNGHIER